MTIVRKTQFYGDQLVEMKRYIDAAELLDFSVEIRLEGSVSKHVKHVLKIDVIDPCCKDYAIGVPVPDESQDFVGISESQRKPY